VVAVLLDMGGVLIPEVPDYSGARNHPMLFHHLRRLGVEDPGTLTEETGTRIREAYRQLQAQCVQPDLHVLLSDLSPEVRRLLMRAFAQEAARTPFAHAREVVAELAKRYRLGLVSNTVIPGDHHARRLTLYGILPHIGPARWSANFGRRKPDPAMLRVVLAELRVPPQQAVFVGDKIRTDVEAAKRAGVRSIWLRQNGALPTEGPRPDFVIQDLRELPLLLRQLDPSRREDAGRSSQNADRPPYRGRKAQTRSRK
jgi:HAD superfamily hydrolase (TIGR01549 family)